MRVGLPGHPHIICNPTWLVGAITQLSHTRIAPTQHITVGLAATGAFFAQGYLRDITQAGHLYRTTAACRGSTCSYPASFTVEYVTPAPHRTITFGDTALFVAHTQRYAIGGIGNHRRRSHECATTVTGDASGVAPTGHLIIATDDTAVLCP